MKAVGYPAQPPVNLLGQFNQQMYNPSIVYNQQPQYYQQQQYYLPTQQMANPQPQFNMSLPAPQPVQPQFAPSYETPQGTYFFVPSFVLPVSSAVEMPSMMAPSPPMAVESWDQLASIPLPPVEPFLASAPVEPKPAPATAAKSSTGAVKKPKKKNTTKRFLCPHPGCGRAFARNFNLGSHVKSHLGIREFDCPRCPKKFSRRHDRARHCAAVHDLHHIAEEEDVEGCEA